MEDLTEEGIAFTFHSFEAEKKADSLPTLPSIKTEDLPPLPPLPRPSKSRNNGIVLTG
jgi:hypothetical protein